MWIWEFGEVVNPPQQRSFGFGCTVTSAPTRVISGAAQKLKLCFGFTLLAEVASIVKCRCQHFTPAEMGFFLYFRICEDHNTL